MTKKYIILRLRESLLSDIPFSMLFISFEDFKEIEEVSSNFRILEGKILDVKNTKTDHYIEIVQDGGKYQEFRHVRNGFRGAAFSINDLEFSKEFLDNNLFENYEDARLIFEVE